ncbi:MAG: SdpI family protein [Polyangiales bacterium]
MQASDVTAVIMMVHTGAIMTLVALPLWRRKVKPNKLYGFRLRSTLQNEALWYEVNAATGRDLTLVGVGLLVLTLGLAFAGASAMWVSMSGLAWLTLGVSAMVAHGYLVVGRWERAQR